jgi:hypothetical protein
MAESTRVPMAMAIPLRDIILDETPMKYMGIKESTMATGKVIIATNPLRK